MFCFFVFFFTSLGSDSAPKHHCGYKNRQKQLLLPWTNMSLCCTSFDFVHFDFTLIKIRMASIVTRILRENCVLKISRFFMLIFTDWLQYSSMQMTPVHYLYLQIMNTITWNIFLFGIKVIFKEVLVKKKKNMGKIQWMSSQLYLAQRSSVGSNLSDFDQLCLEWVNVWLHHIKVLRLKFIMN